VLNDPLTGRPFPNNIIPSSRFSPAALKLLSLSPLPDPDGFVRYTINQPENGLQGIGKLDYVPSPKHSFVFRIFESDGNQPFHSPPDNIHAARYSGYRDSLSATLGHTFVVNPTTVVHTQLTGAHQLANIATDFPYTTADLGVNLKPMGNHIDITLTQSRVSFNQPLHQIRFGRGSIEVQHDWNKQMGNHTLVFEMNIVRKRFNNNTLFHSSGQFSPTVTQLDQGIRQVMTEPTFCWAHSRFSPRTAANSSSVEVRRRAGILAIRGEYVRDSPSISVSGMSRTACSQTCTIVTRHSISLPTVLAPDPRFIRTLCPVSFIMGTPSPQAMAVTRSARL
jgi:hypothetical protein